MKKWVVLLTCSLLMGLTTAALAQDNASLEERVRLLEKAIGGIEAGNSWWDRIQISGLVEVEAYYQDADQADDSSDVDLATVELAVDARIIDHVDGRVLFKWEDDDLFVDEGFITLTGTHAFPAYLIAGRQYLPFGRFDTHFITDPNTLVLGETNEGSVVAGYRIGGELVDISVGAFNGKIEEAGEDNHVDGFVAGVTAQPFEGLTLGASYISNLASSDALSEMITDRTGDGEIDPVEDFVGGWSAFVTFEFQDRFRLIGEYVAALEDFEAGEVYIDTDPDDRKPAAWNAEFGVMIVEDLELALRYGGSDDGADFLPEKQYGAVINWGVFSYTNLALEYLHDEYEDDVEETDTVTAQLAIEF